MIRGRALSLLLVGVLLTSGCASLQHAITQTPQRAQDMWEDPVRREHFLTQVGLESSTATVGIVCASLMPFPFSLIVCPLAAVLYNFTAYEFVLEPISKDLVKHGEPSKVGPYWERGPQDGEVFINP